MADVSIYMRMEVTVDGVVTERGSLTTPVKITAASEDVREQVFTIADSTVMEILSDSLQSDFDFLWIESDTDGRIQLLVGEDQTGQLGLPIPIKAGVPFVLAADDSAYNMDDVDVWEDPWKDSPGNGTLDNFDRIEWFHNTSGNGNAKVRIITIT